MSDFLSRLIRRSFKHADAIRPRPASVFESTASGRDATFRHASERDAANELPLHPRAATRPRTSVSLHTRPIEAEISKFEEKPNRAETPAPGRPKTMAAPYNPSGSRSRPLKTGDAAVKSVEAIPTRYEMENRASPSNRETEKSIQQASLATITPSESGSFARKEDRNPRYMSEPPRGDNSITPPSESTGAPLNATGPGYIEVSNHMSATDRVFTVHTKTDKLAGNAKELPSTKKSDGDRGFADQRSVTSIGARPHLPVPSEQTGWLPFRPANRAEAPASVQVTIGRLEVKANLTREAKQPRQRKMPSGVMTLSDYLRRSGRGGRE